jgi:hypothetical protein
MPSEGSVEIVSATARDFLALAEQNDRYAFALRWLD